MTQFLSNRDIYESVICGIVPQVKERLWIATADIKDMYVDSGGRERGGIHGVQDVGRDRQRRGSERERGRRYSPSEQLA